MVEREAARRSAAESPKAPASAMVAYMVSRFPMSWETFILYEMEEMEKLGINIQLYPLWHGKTEVVHAEARPWMQRAHYLPFLSFSMFAAHWHFIRRAPGRYFRTLIELLRGTSVCIRCFGGALAFFPKVVRFAYEIREKGIHHLHAHFAYQSATAALVVHRLTQIPFSFTAHGSDIQADGHMLKEKVEAAEFIITVTQHNKEIILSECGPGVAEKIHVIHGGVDVERLSPRRECEATQLLRILCVARFEEVKGHAYLAEACRILKERGVPFECGLVGEGPLLPQIEKQIQRSNLSGEVLLLGALPYDEVIEQYSRADVVVLATAPTASGKREGSPTVLKEAMACGLPVVSSRVGGIPEIVDDGETGILVAPRDAVALADALQRLSDDPALRGRLGCAGREKSLREFNLRLSTARRAKLFAGEADCDVKEMPITSRSREFTGLTFGGVGT